MGFASDDPLEILDSVREAARTRRATARDFTAPTGGTARHIEVPAPGVVHPAHVRWIAECLKRTPRQVRTMLEKDGVAPLAKALARARSTRLRKLKVSPSELVLRRIPIPPGRARPNVTPPRSGEVLSPLNAALQTFDRECRTLTRFVKVGAPDFIVHLRAMELQRRFQSVVDVVGGRGLPFEDELELPTDPPTPPELIIPPPDVGGWFHDPARPLGMVVEGNTAVVRFYSAIARIDLATGDFSTHPLGEAGVVRLHDGRALLLRGSRLVVFDTRTDSFTVEQPELPRYLVLGAWSSRETKLSCTARCHEHAVSSVGEC